MTLDAHNALDEAKDILKKDSQSLKPEEVNEAHNNFLAAYDEDAYKEKLEEDANLENLKEAVEELKATVADIKENYKLIDVSAAEELLEKDIEDLTLHDVVTTNDKLKEAIDNYDIIELDDAKATLTDTINKVDELSLMSIDLHNAKADAEKLLEKEDVTLEELRGANSKLAQLYDDKKAEIDQINELKKNIKPLIEKADKKEKVTLDQYNALEKAKKLIAINSNDIEALGSALEKLDEAFPGLAEEPEEPEETETIADKFGDKIQIRPLEKQEGETVAVEEAKMLLGQPVGMTDDEWASAVDSLEITKNLTGEEKAGQHEIEVKLTFSDDSTITVTIPVTVIEKENDKTMAEEYEVTIKDITITVDDKVTEQDILDAVVVEGLERKEASAAETRAKEEDKWYTVALAEGAELPDVTKTGAFPVKVLVTFGDGSTKTVTVNVVVEEKASETPDESDLDKAKKAAFAELEEDYDLGYITLEERLEKELAVEKAETVEEVQEVLDSLTPGEGDGETDKPGEGEEGDSDEKDPWDDLINWEGLKDQDDKAWDELINWEGLKDLINKGEKPGKDWDGIFDWDGIKDLVENNQKPGEKPGKDWNDLIDWDKLEDLLGKGEEGQKPGEGEDESTINPPIKDEDPEGNKPITDTEIDLGNVPDLEDILFPDKGEGQEPGEGSGEETPNKPGKDWNDLIDWDKLEDLLGKGDEGQKPGTGGEESEKPGQGNEGEKPGTGGQESEKPAKDWLELIDWDKVKELLAKKGDKKPGKQEEVKTGKKEEAKKGKKEAAKKLPQTGAVASLGSAALGLALTTLGAGFAFRKRQ